jgi:hypothetical protein
MPEVLKTSDIVKTPGVYVNTGYYACLDAARGERNDGAGTPTVIIEIATGSRTLS